MPNLRAENRALLQLIEGIKNDLLMRGTKDEDGITVVELSNGLWRRINDTLGSRTAEGLGKPSMASGRLPEHHKQWFDQIKLAGSNGNLALMSCLDSLTMEHRSVLALVSHDQGQFLMTPVGHLCPADNPYEAYLPPLSEQEVKR